MDKQRHPQVIRPWKIEPMQKSKLQAPSKSDPRHEGKSRPHSFRFKAPGS